MQLKVLSQTVESIQEAHHCFFSQRPPCLLKSVEMDTVAGNFDDCYPYTGRPKFLL